ncbi:PIN domain-containing protein [Thiothrix litoralis]|uniref:PIN domain-containing protein n=1 Tax=Thiothrix litoralis TaxID=2891210 RepID=A0ABX7WVA9_9GAMM|nr:PIN domain-containing protein [Thiothrix litoralis]QTR45599.1 PIN domain-containing protein [Thiothrix litoralis]
MKILDTDVCIELLRGNQRVLEARSQTLDLVATTWITACELAYGAANSSKPQHNHILVTEFLATLPILDFNLAAAELFGRNKALLKQTGNTVADADLMISSITLAQGGILVTGNIRHYDRIPHLRIEDWIRG